MERFQSVEEIQNLMSVVPPPEAGNSFTALLDLPANQAVMLLHSPEETVPDTFFSSVFLTNSNDDSFNLVKHEPVDSDSMHNSSSNLSDLITSNSLKRKEPEKNVKSSMKKSKNVSNEIDCEKLPYVYVRAPRGQATDSHSLAERARREKINAKMKFLQELVPGCNKISGTTMVLDEIINHVQSLQHQVEFLSMRLAALHPNININLDTIFSTESGSLMEDYFTSMVSPPLSHQIWQPVELMNPNFITPENSFFNFDSSGNSVSLHTNNLKMEL